MFDFLVKGVDSVGKMVNFIDSCEEVVVGQLCVDNGSKDTWTWNHK